MPLCPWRMAVKPRLPQSTKPKGVQPMISMISSWTNYVNLGNGWNGVRLLGLLQHKTSQMAVLTSPCIWKREAAHMDGRCSGQNVKAPLHGRRNPRKKYSVLPSFKSTEVMTWLVVTVLPWIHIWSYMGCCSLSPQQGPGIWWWHGRLPVMEATFKSTNWSKSGFIAWSLGWLIGGVTDLIEILT